MDESVRSEAKDFIMWERTWMNKDRLMDELVEKAKKAVVRAWEGRETTERRWHTISFVPYGNMREQRLEIHILVGTPVKGFVVANYGLGVLTIGIKSSSADIASCKKHSNAQPSGRTHLLHRLRHLKLKLVGKKLELKLVR